MAGEASLKAGSPVGCFSFAVMGPSVEFLVYPGQYLNGDAHGGDRSDGSAGACLRRIQKNREAGEDEIAFVTDRGSLAARIDNAAGHAQRAESLSTEFNERGLEGAACA